MKPNCIIGKGIICRAAQGTALLLLAVLCGCGKGEPKSRSVEASETQREVASWNVADCLEVSLPDTANADFYYSFSAVDGSCYYVLEDLVTEQGEQFGHTLYWASTDVHGTESVLKKWQLQATVGADKEVQSLLEAFGG